MSSSQSILTKGPFWLGVISLLGGIFLVASPHMAVFLSISISFLIGWAFLIIGILSLFAVLAGKEGLDNLFWLLIAIAALLILFGGFLVMNPVRAALTLTWILAAFYLLGGIVKIVFAFSFQKEARWVFLISGILSALVAMFIFMAWPSSGTWFIGFLIGIDMLVFGVSQLMLVMSVSHLKKELEKELEKEE